MILEIKDICKSFHPPRSGTIEVLKQVSFGLLTGETNAVTGQSGSGKTTLLSLIAGLDNPDSGAVILDGENLCAMDENRLSRFRAIDDYYSLYGAFALEGRGGDVPALAGKLRKTFYENHQGQPLINVYDSRDVNRRLGLVTRYFTGYMGLVSVVALFLAGIATAYLFRGTRERGQRSLRRVLGQVISFLPGLAAFSLVSVFVAVSVTLLTITDRLSLSIRFMAWLAIAAGLVSIFFIARHGAWKNETQVNLLKVLGADFKAIQGITLLEFGFTGFTAALFAVLLSLGFSRIFSWYFFDNLWQFDLLGSLVIFLLTTGICMATAFTASRKVMNTKPVTLLSNTFDRGEI
jgi:ABC-type cobalamin/Fe3+-siderophores transport system ATPase subunit